MAQFGRPISDLQNTSITGTFAAIDESTPNDADYLYSADQANTIYECGLTSPLSDPTVSSGHTFRYRIAESDGGVAPGDGTGNLASVVANLYKGTTLIASDVSRNGPTSWTTYTYTLTSGEADSIGTGYTDLRLLFNITGSGGPASSRRGIAISWAEFEIPDKLPIEVSLTLSGDSTISNTGTFSANTSVSLTGDSTFTTSGGKEATESVVLSGDSNITTSYLLTVDRSLILSGNSTLTNTNIANFVGNIVFSSDTVFSDSNVGNLLNSGILSGNTTLGAEGSQNFDKTITLTSDVIFSASSFVSSTYNENITLGIFIDLQTGVRKSDYFTLVNVSKITSIGKITT